MCILLFLSTVLRSSLEEAALELFMFPSLFGQETESLGRIKKMGIFRRVKRGREVAFGSAFLFGWVGLGAYIKIVGMGQVSGEPPLLYHVTTVLKT